MNEEEKKRLVTVLSEFGQQANIQQSNEHCYFLGAGECDGQVLGFYFAMPNDPKRKSIYLCKNHAFGLYRLLGNFMAAMTRMK